MRPSLDGLIWILLLFALPAALVSSWAVRLDDAGITSWAVLVVSGLVCVMGFTVRWRVDPFEATRISVAYLACALAMCLWLILDADGSQSHASYVAIAVLIAGAALGLAYLAFSRRARRNPGALGERFPFAPLFERDAVQVLPRWDGRVQAGAAATLTLHIYNCTDRERRVALWLYCDPPLGVVVPPVPMQTLQAAETREVQLRVQTSPGAAGSRCLRIGLTAQGLLAKRAVVAHGEAFRNPIRPELDVLSNVMTGVTVEGGIPLALEIVR